MMTNIDVLATRDFNGVEFRVYVAQDTCAPDPRVDWDCDDSTTIALWADGEVYGYVIESQCPGCSGWEHVDSCWGLYGYDYACQEAREALQSL
jgi:hypothetical protein